MEILSKYINKLSSSSNTIFRGHADSSWALKPSIGRNFTGKWEEVLKWEVESLAEFKKRSIPYLKQKPNSDIEWLCLMQHHGCATRLIDFTSNPLIALFFATDPTIEKDGEIIIAEFGRKYENVSNDGLFERANSFAYYPPHITERIVGQSGCFVYSNKPNRPLNGKQLNKVKILKKDKTNLRYFLKKLGVSYSSLFPGLDGVCQDLNNNLLEMLELEELF